MPLFSLNVQVEKLVAGQCSRTSSRILSADGTQTAGLAIQPFQTVAEDVRIWSVGPKAQCESPI